MNKSILYSLVFSIGILTSCKETNASLKVDQTKLEEAKKRDVEITKGAALIEFDKTEYDFGTVTDGDVIQTTFSLKNVGKTALVITDAKTTCGCTVPTWPKNKPVMPGETTEIEVKFNTSGKGGGRQVKTVTLLTNTAIGREVLKIKGIVNKKFK